MGQQNYTTINFLRQKKMELIKLKGCSNFGPYCEPSEGIPSDLEITNMTIHILERNGFAYMWDFGHICYYRLLWKLYNEWE